MALTKDIVNAISKDIDKIFPALEAKYGVKFKTSGSFSNAQFNYKLTAMVVTAGDDNLSADEILYKKNIERFSFQFDLNGLQHGDRFKYRNTEYTFIGIDSRSRKYPLVGKKIGSDLLTGFAEDSIRGFKLLTPRAQSSTKFPPLADVVPTVFEGEIV